MTLTCSICNRTIRDTDQRVIVLRDRSLDYVAHRDCQRMQYSEQSRRDGWADYDLDRQNA